MYSWGDTDTEQEAAGNNGTQKSARAEKLTHELYPLSNQEPRIRQYISFTPQEELRHRTRTARDKGLVEKMSSKWHRRRSEGMLSPPLLTAAPPRPRLPDHKGTPANGESHVVVQAHRPMARRGEGEVTNQLAAKRGLGSVRLNVPNLTGCGLHPDAARETTESSLHLLHFLLLLLPLHESNLHEEGDSGAVNAVATSQRRHSEERSFPQGAPHGAVAPLTDRLPKRGVVCLRGASCVAFTSPSLALVPVCSRVAAFCCILHLLLPRSSAAVECSCQSHADAMLLVSQPRAHAPLPATSCTRRTIAFNMVVVVVGVEWLIILERVGAGHSNSKIN